jgi:transcriptional regulator with GAF, ATPase, and Fis domain
VELQPKLLRAALQEKPIERLSGMRLYDVDVHIVAATNQDLEQFVKELRFPPTFTTG